MNTIVALNSCDPEELQIRENFKKDYKLSCPVVDDNDVFAKSLNMFHMEEKYNEYSQIYKNNQKNIDQYRKQIRNNVVNHISNVHGFDKLQPVEYEAKYKGDRTCMRDSCVGQILVSLDLVKANYQSLKYLDPKFVLHTRNYNDLIQRFTKDKLMTECRMLRQLIFGFLKPEVQVSVQRMIMQDVIDKVYQEISSNQISIEQLTNDEVVFQVSDEKLIDELKRIAINVLPYDIRVTQYDLRKIKNKYDEPWYVRTNLTTGEERIVGVHIKYLFQVYNHLHQIENTPKDFWWRERGRLCALLEPEEFLD